MTERRVQRKYRGVYKQVRCVGLTLLRVVPRSLSVY